MWCSRSPPRWLRAGKILLSMVRGVSSSLITVDPAGERLIFPPSPAGHGDFVDGTARGLTRQVLNPRGQLEVVFEAPQRSFTPFDVFFPVQY